MNEKQKNEILAKEAIKITSCEVNRIVTERDRLRTQNAELRKALEDIASGFGDIEVPEEVRQLAEQSLTRHPEVK